jgi:hypothetical protein
MGRRKPTARIEFVLFNVIYGDGTVTSSKVPSSMLGGLDDDAPARHFIEAQDRKIARSPSARAGHGRGSSPSVEQDGRPLLV